MITGIGLIACSSEDAAIPVAERPAFASPSAQGLLDSAAKGDLDAVRIALNHGVDPESIDARGFTPLLIASLRGHTNVVDALLAAGADPDQAGLHGATPLMGAG